MSVGLDVLGAGRPYSRRYCTKSAVRMLVVGVQNIGGALYSHSCGNFCKLPLRAYMLPLLIGSSS